MAHILKITAPGAEKILKYCTREETTNSCFSSLSPENYYLIVKRNGDAFECQETNAVEIKERYHERIKNVYSVKRADLKTMGSLLVTAPIDLPKNEERKFFEACIKYAAEKLGEKNIIGGCVHYNKPENRPHIHILFTPIIYDNKKNREKFCCREVITKKFLLQLHPELSRAVARELGHDVSILNGITKASGGNRTISQLKYDTAMAAINKQQAELDQQKADLGRQRTALESEKAEISDEWYRLLNEETAIRQQKEANEKESKRLADLLSEINAARAAARAEADKLAAEKAALDQQKADLDKRESKQ